MISLTYNTGVLKLAEVITGISGCVSFQGEDAQGFYSYNDTLNKLAGKTIVIVDSDEPNYDYKTLGMIDYGIRSEWLDNITTNVYWELVPVDTLVEVSIDNVNWMRRHFAGYDPDSPDGKLYYVYISGKSSQTVTDLQEKIRIITTGKNAESLLEKYFFIYSPNEAFYVWFDVGNTGSDPDPASPGGQPLTEIEVNLNVGDTDSVIATKLRYALSLYSDFSPAITSNTTIEVTVNTAGNTYDILDGNSGLSLAVIVPGGSEESFSYARLA